MLKKSFKIILIALIGFVLAAYFLSMGYHNYAAAKKRQVVLEKRKMVWGVLEKQLESEAANFKGEAAIIVRDLDMRWEIALNKEKPFPSASLVKIPVMAACFFAARQGVISLKDSLALKASAKVPGSGILKNAAAGSVFTVERLIEIMITESDNTAANLLIERLTLDYLNDFFKKYGLAHTNLSRKMMDFKYRRKGRENYTTAADIAYLLEKIYRKEFLDKLTSEQCLTVLLRQKVNDRIPAKLPADTPVAHKTGLERQVCHDAGIVFSAQGDFLICVLTKSKTARKEVKAFIAKVALCTYNSYRRIPRS
jgi:beta-lactamase class A